MNNTGRKSPGHDNAPKARLGRPRKKPDYDKDQTIQELIAKATELFEEPYDDREERSSDAPTVADVAREMKTTRIRIRKLLITAGYFSTAASRKVQQLAGEGLSEQEICEKTGLKRASVHSYLPYEKGVYNLEELSLNAELCRRFRTRKQVCKQLADNLDSEDSIEYLWKTIQAFESYTFSDGEGSRIKYHIDCDELCFGNTRVCRRTVVEAYRTIRRMQQQNGCVNSPDCMDCCGARELYQVFLRFGICEKSF